MRPDHGSGQGTRSGVSSPGRERVDRHVMILQSQHACGILCCCFTGLHHSLSPAAGAFDALSVPHAPLVDGIQLRRFVLPSEYAELAELPRVRPVRPSVAKVCTA